MLIKSKIKEEMKNIEVTVATNTETSEIVADILYELGSNGVAIYDTEDVESMLKSDIIWDYIDEKLLKKSEIVTVKGYYDTENISDILLELDSALEKLRNNSLSAVGSLEVTTMEIDDQDWVNVWRKYYKPIHTGRIVVVPNWIKYEPKDGETPIFIDSGMAFGTGEHETTRLCLELLSELDTSGKDVLDIGTGSGILGIAAAALGAKSVFMSDLDIVAVESAKKNLALNTVVSDVTIKQCDLLSETDISGDIVLANITADILIRLSKDIKEHMRPSGYLIISGIIHMRADDVRGAFLAAGLKLDTERVDGEWRAMRFVREN